MILTVAETYERVKDGPVFYTRFGDGEVIYMAGRMIGGLRLEQGKAYMGSREVFDRDFQRELIEAFELKDDRFLKALALDYKIEPGMSNGCFAPSAHVDRLKKMVRIREKTYYNPVCFHYLFAFKPELWDEFVKTLGRVLFVGGVDAGQVDRIIPIDGYIHTPFKAANVEINDIWKKIKPIANNYDTIIPTCGLASAVINKRLFESGFKGSALDLGSLFDLWVEPYSRGWLKVLGDDIKKRYAG